MRKSTRANAVEQIVPDHWMHVDLPIPPDLQNKISDEAIRNDQTFNAAIYSLLVDGLYLRRKRRKGYEWCIRYAKQVQPQIQRPTSED